MLDTDDAIIAFETVRNITRAETKYLSGQHSTTKIEKPIRDNGLKDLRGLAFAYINGPRGSKFTMKKPNYKHFRNVVLSQITNL
jgi:hypothetical protein